MIKSVRPVESRLLPLYLRQRQKAKPNPIRVSTQISFDDDPRFRALLRLYGIVIRCACTATVQTRNSLIGPAVPPPSSRRIVSLWIISRIPEVYLFICFSVSVLCNPRNVSCFFPF